MTQLPVRVAPFEPVRSYDVPNVLLSSILDGEFDSDTLRNALFSTEGLTAAERETYVTRLKERLGRGSFSDALVDVATNPFVWMSFLLSPVGGATMRGGTQSMFHAAPKYGAWVMNRAPVLGFLMNDYQLFTNTPVPVVLGHISESIAKAGDEAGKHINQHLDKLREVLQAKHGTSFKILDPAMEANPQKAAILQEIDDTIGAWLRGWDQEVTELVPKLDMKKLREAVKAGSDTSDDAVMAILEGMSAEQRGLLRGVFSMQQVKRARYLDTDLTKRLKELGAYDLAEGYRKAMDERWVRLFGNDAVWEQGGRFVADLDKVKDVWSGLRNKVTNGSLSIDSDSGAAVISNLMGAEIGELVAKGVVGADEFFDVVRQVAEAPMTGRGGGRAFYMPRNMMDLWGEGVPAAELKAQRESRSFVATGRAWSRRATQPLWHPEDLERMRERFGSYVSESDVAEHGGVATLDRLIAQQGESLRKASAAAGANGVAVHRLKGVESLHRYFKDTGESWALYVQTLDNAPRVRVAKEEFEQYFPQAMRETFDKEKAALGVRSSGRTTMADMLREAYGAISGAVDNPKTKHYSAAKLRDVLLPMVTGRMRDTRHQASLSALLWGKQMANAFLDTAAGKGLKEGRAGKWAQDFAEKMEKWADYTTPIPPGNEMSSRIARYLYVTHLGFNMGSVVLNLTQPLLLATTWMGARNVLPAYWTAFKELGSYMTERVGKYGVRPLDDVTHRGLLEKHFKWSSVNAARDSQGRWVKQDLLGIGRDAYETLDNVSFPTRRIGSATHRESPLLDFPMKFFEKAEWLNRSVTAHAMENMYRAAGRSFVEGSDDYFRLLNDVKEMVSETQFGGSILNTPMAFLEGPLANPLMRQFLTFPVRAFTGLALKSARLGGRPIGPLAMAHDFARGMGISAIAYETTKNLLGADLSRGLFGASVTDIVGGERFLESDGIGLPPVLDIPKAAIRAMATGDLELWKQTIPRVFPGGVALARAVGVLPHMDVPVIGKLVEGFQRTYVDWNQPAPNGMYPVFKGDGTLIDYKHGPSLVLRGLGVDLNRFQNEAEIDGFLVKNRDQIVEYRRQAIAAVLANNVPKMQQIRSTFERRFGMPLTITEQQIKEAVRLRQVPRTERILDRLPPDIKPLYTEMVANSKSDNLALTREQIIEAETSRQRNAVRAIEPVRLDPATLAALREAMKQPDAEEQVGTSFIGFGAFNQ